MNPESFFTILRFFRNTIHLDKPSDKEFYDLARLILLDIMLTPNKRPIEDSNDQSLKKCKKAVVCHVGESSDRSSAPDPCGSGFQLKDLAQRLLVIYHTGESSDAPLELNLLMSQFQSEELVQQIMRLINDAHDEDVPLHLPYKIDLNEMPAETSVAKERKNIVDVSELDQDVLTPLKLELKLGIDEMAAETFRKLEEVDWSLLDEDVLARIAEKELSLDDFFSFSLVCRSWHRAAAACNLGEMRRHWAHNQMPWLMLTYCNTDVDEDGYSKTGFVLPRVLNDIEECGDDIEFMSEARSGGEELYTRCVLNLRRSTSYNFKCPELHGRSCWGSAYGWIVTAGSDGKMFMFTKTHVSLPSFGTFHRRWDNEEDIRRNHFVKRAVLLNVGADDAQSYGDGVEHLRVVVFYSDHHNVAVVKPGNRRWVEIEAGREVYPPLMDVLYDRELGLVFVDRFWGLARCNLPQNEEPPLLQWIKIREKVSYIGSPIDYMGLYIVKVGSDILMLLRYMYFPKSTDGRLRAKNLASRGVDICSYMTPAVVVFRLDYRNKWTKYRNEELKDIALFAGNNTTMWADARKTGCLGDHVYFSDDLRRDNWRTKGMLGGDDNGIYYAYNEDEEIEPLCAGRTEPSSYSFPFFFKPSISKVKGLK